MKWTVKKASVEFGVSEATVRSGLIAAGIEVKPGLGAAFTTRQIAAAIFGDIKHERMLKTRAERQLLELEQQEKAKELISVDAATDMITRALLPARQRLLALPSEMAARTNPTDPLFAQRALDAWAERALRQIQSAITATKQ